MILSSGVGRGGPVPHGRGGHTAEGAVAEIKAADAWGSGLARTELVTSGRTVLRIEVVIGDAGELEDPKGPYEFERGEFLDMAGWVELD